MLPKLGYPKHALPADPGGSRTLASASAPVQKVVTDGTRRRVPEVYVVLRRIDGRWTEPEPEIVKGIFWDREEANDKALEVFAPTDCNTAKSDYEYVKRRNEAEGGPPLKEDGWLLNLGDADDLWIGGEYNEPGRAYSGTGEVRYVMETEMGHEWSVVEKRVVQ
ncbi:hypothetical protein LTR85_007751 [Meristemomyces frigidus]|nr:hypothetical protein LTR85_007751 [Meristemomyces frigidus]